MNAILTARKHRLPSSGTQTETAPSESSGTQTDPPSSRHGFVVAKKVWTELPQSKQKVFVFGSVEAIADAYGNREAVMAKKEKIEELSGLDNDTVVVLLDKDNTAALSIAKVTLDTSALSGGRRKTRKTRGATKRKTLRRRK